VKAHVIGVSVNQGHTPVFSDPIELPLPNINVALAKNDKKREVLDERVRKLDIPTPVRAGHPEWKDGSDAIGLGLEGIGIERRGIVIRIQFMEPSQLVLHKGRTKSERIPV